MLKAGTGMPFLAASGDDIAPGALRVLDGLAGRTGRASGWSASGCLSKASLILPRNTLRMMQPPRHIRAMPP